ncbi:MAG: DUF1846 domain-containing protein [Candidatus Omnitrophota bacterium]
MKKGFDNEKYLSEQTKAILDRVAQFDHKLYLEFGGKLLFDYHASRVLPGYDPSVKMQLLKRLKDKIEIIICIYAKDIEAGRLRGDFGMTYDLACLKTIDDLKDWGLNVTNVVITRFKSEPLAIKFKNRLERKGIQVYLHYEIKGYPGNIDKIVSKAGYGRNEYIKTEKPIVVVTAPGPGSGKLAACLSQMYHDHKKGIDSGYAKFETFPIWNLPLHHPVNVAYESATADLADYNLVDPHHLKTYNKKSINYNRDVDAFPILKSILEKIIGKSAKKIMYNSPTDMGVNRAGFGIIDDEAVKAAAKQEIIRRFFRYHWEFMLGLEKKETVERAKELMKQEGLKEEDRACVLPARKAAEDAAKTSGKGNNGVFCGAAIELAEGKIITGKNSPLMHAASAAVINAIKHLAEVPDKIHLLPSNVIGNIAALKKDILDLKTESLDLEETLVALSISAAANPTAEAAVKALKALGGCEMHMSHIPSRGDEAGLRKLKINFTCDAQPTSHYFLR